MRIVPGSRSLEKPLLQAVLTVGNFDGVHVGHRAIMATVIERARARGGDAAVYTFEPHPRKVLRPEGQLRLLTTLEQKLELLEELGVDVVIVEPFDRGFADLPAERFAREILHARIHPVELYVGYDFRYGRDREGSLRTLTELGPRLGFEVRIIPEVRVGGRVVNSTRIRELLAAGSVEEAAELLARPYAVRGRVVEGDRRGRSLGFPTLNLEPENEILPARGVYAGWVRFLDAGDPPAGSHFAAVTNVGRRPTFSEEDQVRAEAHLLDRELAAYGRRIEISFDHRLRGERRFEGPEALRAQIARDAHEARRRLERG